MGSMEKSQVISLLRACLISAKGGIRIEDLNRDFRVMTDLPGIPFRQLGYHSIEDFLRNTDAVRVFQRGGQWIVEAARNEKTQHITNMVARQKTSKSKSKNKHSMRTPIQSSRFRSSFSTNHSTSMSRNNRGGIMNSTKPYSQSNYSNSTRPIQQRVLRPIPLLSPPQVRDVRPPLFDKPPIIERTNAIRPTALLPTPQFRDVRPPLFDKPPIIEHTNAIRPTPLLSLPRHNELRPPLLNLPLVPPSIEPRTIRLNPLISPLQYYSELLQPLVSPFIQYTNFRPLISPTQNGPLRPLLPLPITNKDSSRYTSTNQQNSLPPLSVRLSQPHINQSVNKPVITHKTVHNDDKKPFETNPLTNATKITSKPTSLILSPLSPGQLVKNENKWPSPTETMIPFKLNNVETANNVPKSSQEELKILVVALKLPEPEYKVTEDISKNKRTSTFYALIKIGSIKFNTYPEESKTGEEAKTFAAKLALENFREKHKTFDLTITEDKDLVKKRVQDIVESHTSGIFVQQVATDYEEKYKEHLPTNWLSIIKECSTIAFDRVANNQPILIKSNSINNVTRNSISPKDEPSTIELERLNINSVESVAPKTLELPTEEYWFVHVYCVYDSMDIWGVLIGTEYNEKFESISADMENYYNSDSNIQNPKKIEIGQYYAVKKPESWFRVQCISEDPDNKQLEFLFIDFGYQESCNPNEVYPLHKTFLDFPPQAIQLSLAGLEDFAKCSNTIDTIETYLQDQSLCVEVLNLQDIEQGQVPNAVFYDTSGEADINLNFVMKRKILELLVPNLDAKVPVTEVFVCHVENNGDVFIQIQSESLNLFLELLNKLIQNGLTADELEKCVVKAIDTTQIYFVSFDDNWYRGKVVDINLQTNEVAVLLIDLGRTVNVTKQNLILLENLSPILAEYPQQALKVRLHNIEESMFLDEEFVKKLKEFAPYNESLLAKVVQQSSISPDQPPFVELFKRHDPKHMLISINASLQHLNLTKMQDDGNNNNNNNHKRKRVERSLSRPTLTTQSSVQTKSLKSPKIPSVGEYFDIHISLAANPGNFVVQPYNTDALGTMMMELQETCGAYKGPELTTDALIQGQIYAGKHIDGHWYRVLLRHYIDASSVAVYFCDFGDIAVLTLDRLQPLHNNYLELPYQAIKAKLVGIEPVDKDWSVEDTLEFQQLVVDKNFVSLIVESNIDETHNDIVLGLRLINTTTEEDVYIDQFLVDKGRAVKVKTNN